MSCYTVVHVVQPAFEPRIYFRLKKMFRISCEGFETIDDAEASKGTGGPWQRAGSELFDFLVVDIHPKLTYGGIYCLHIDII